MKFEENMYVETLKKKNNIDIITKTDQSIWTVNWNENKSTNSRKDRILVFS